MRPWGKMGKFYGIYSFALSPFEQKAFGTFGQDMLNLGRSMLEYWWVLSVVPIAYGLRDYGSRMEDKRLRKDPAKFAGDA